MGWFEDNSFSPKFVAFWLPALVFAGDPARGSDRMETNGARTAYNLHKKGIPFTLISGKDLAANWSKAKSYPKDSVWLVQGGVVEGKEYPIKRTKIADDVGKFKGRLKDHLRAQEYGPLLERDRKAQAGIIVGLSVAAAITVSAVLFPEGVALGSAIIAAGGGFAGKLEDGSLSAGDIVDAMEDTGAVDAAMEAAGVDSKTVEAVKDAGEAAVEAIAEAVDAPAEPAPDAPPQDPAPVDPVASAWADLKAAWNAGTPTDKAIAVGVGLLVIVGGVVGIIRRGR